MPSRKYQTNKRIQEKLSTLLTLQEIPDYLKDNEFIHTGWRSEMSFWSASRTLFQWHNESLNIWTHLVGVPLFIIWSVHQTCMTHLIYFIGATFVCSCSTLYHLYFCVSFTYFDVLRKLDFMGIVVVMWSMFPPMIEGAWGIRHRWESWLYLTGASFISIFSMALAVTPMFQTNAFHKMRVGIFAMNGIWGLIALTHIIITIDHMRVAAILAYIAIGLHATGSMFYALKFPESRSMLVCFHYVQGHTLFHLFVLLGLVTFGISISFVTNNLVSN